MAEHMITPLYACSFSLTHEQYQQRYDDLRADGYRLVMVDGYRSGSELRYGGIWFRDRRSEWFHARHGINLHNYEADSSELRSQGFALQGLSGFSSSDAEVTKFMGLWEEGSDRNLRTRHNLSANDYQAAFDELAEQDFDLIYVTGWADDDRLRYAGIWQKNLHAPRRCRHNLPSSEYQATFDELKREGYHIDHVNAHEAGGETFFAGVWVQRDGYEPQGRHGMSADEFRTKLDEFAKSDHRIVSMSGYRESGRDKFAAVWVPNERTWLQQGRSDPALDAYDNEIRSLMQTHAIPGASFALVRNGRLLMARGYSWITDFETPVSPASLFRLGSVSKTLMGSAIVHLQEHGRLKLSDKVVDLIDMPGITDSKVRDITVNHLLHHVGGWDRDASGRDPMDADLTISRELNVPLPISRESIIRWTNLEPLDFVPGTVDGFKYSNFDYMLLGLIVEAVTGIEYQTYVQNNLLTPLGIHRMRLGRTLLRDRLEGEVLYHSLSNSLRANTVIKDALVNAMNPYGGDRNVENSCYSGAWLASAVDMVRFASSFDDPANCPILSADSVNRLFAQHPFGDRAPGVNKHYGCGWYVDRESAGDVQFHGGALDGVKTQVVRWRYGGAQFNAALLVNKSEEDTAPFGLQDLIRDTTKTIRSWPAGGDFGEFL